MQNRIRLRVDYGDIKTGKSWNEIHGVCGYVGRSTGKFKIPILMYNKISWGGSTILDHCVVKIAFANKQLGGVLYCHPTYFKIESYDITIQAEKW